MHETRLDGEEFFCPHCGAVFNIATTSQPQMERNIGVCAYCFKYLAFRNQKLCKVSEEELAKLPEGVTQHLEELVTKMKSEKFDTPPRKGLA